jgi:hypothetical protein
LANQKVSILQGTDGTLYDIDDQTKLEKTTYEWNREIKFGNTGSLFIGSFPMYDSNLTVTISATTGITYHGTLVLATQNAKNNQAGTYTATVYGDAANTIAPNIFIERVSNSNIYNIYFKPQTWSKNLIHIQAVALNVDASIGSTAPSAVTNICTAITSIPATATIKPKNALVENFLGSSDNITVKNGDILALNNKELSTQYSIKTTVAVGNLASGTTVNGSVKELLDLVFGTPTKITSFTLTTKHGSYEKGTTVSLTKAVVNVQKGTANTLDKIEIRSGSASGTVLATLTNVKDGSNPITIPTQTITADTTIYAVLTHDGSNTKSSSLKYTFYYYTYYGAVSAATSVDSITYTSLTKKNGNTGLKITMSNQCAVLAIPGTSVKTIKDENNFDCTGNFSKTTKTIANSLGASTTYTVFKLITPVSGTKTYTVS